MSSSSAISKIIEHSACNPSFTHAYFFFDSRSAEDVFTRHEKFLRSLIQQFLDQLEGRPPDAVLKIYGKGHRQPSLQELEHMLLSILPEFECAYIIVDALDECADNERLVTWIKRLSGWDGMKLHMLFFSRPEPEIKDLFFGAVAGAKHVQLAPDSANLDIETFLDGQLASIKRWNPAIRTLVKNTLMGGADGMYVKISDAAVI